MPIEVYDHKFKMVSVVACFNSTMWSALVLAQSRPRIGFYEIVILLSDMRITKPEGARELRVYAKGDYNE